MTKGERTRQEILNAARQVIMDKGYTAASMREIADVVGITPAAIYNHFSGKEALFTAVLQEVVPVRELTTFLQGLQGNSAEALVEEAFRGMLQIISTHEDYVRLALIDAQERDGATLATFLPRFFPLMMGFTRRLQAVDGADGRLREQNPALIVRAFVSLVAGYVLTERVMRLEPPGTLPEMDWESGLVNVLLYGLFGPSHGSEGEDGER